MELLGIPFEAMDWNAVEGVEHARETGVAVWRAR